MVKEATHPVRRLDQRNVHLEPLDVGGQRGSRREGEEVEVAVPAEVHLQGRSGSMGGAHAPERQLLRLAPMPQAFNPMTCEMPPLLKQRVSHKTPPGTHILIPFIARRSFFPCLLHSRTPLASGNRRMGPRSPGSPRPTPPSAAPRSRCRRPP